jgi:FkbM family methyltransferase
MEDGLRRLAPGSGVRTVIDVGASDGRWSASVGRLWPDARFLLVEAQSAPHEAGLRALKSRDPRVDYVIAAAGPREGTTHFDASEAFGGAASEHAAGGRDIVVPMTTIDGEVKRSQLPGPFLLKLDTHGYEVPILEGASATLRQTTLLVLEAYNFDLSETCRRFPQMLAWCEERGFRCVDLVDVLHRPADGVLWQMDLILVPRDHAAFRRATYC